MGCIQPARYGESDMGFYFRHLGYTGQPVKNSKTTADVGLPDNQARRSAVVCQCIGYFTERGLNGLFVVCDSDIAIGF